MSAAVLAIYGLACAAGGNSVRDLFHIPKSNQGIGNRKMELYVRTTSPCDFTDLNPKADWTKVDFTKRRAAFFFHYNAFIQAEKRVYSTMKKRNVKITETDSTIIYDISGDMHDKTLFGLSVVSEELSGRYRMQNIMSKENNLLLSFKLWGTQRNGDSILLIYTDNIQYNVKEETDAYMPSGYIRSAMPAMTKEREAFLREESAAAAASRILSALTAGDSLELREAMHGYDISKHIRQHKGARIAKIKMVTSKNQDIMLTYKLSWPKSEKKNTESRNGGRIYLRYDARNNLWRVNGGL